MLQVYLLWHTHELPNGEDDDKLIGVYSSLEKAEQAQLRAATRPGFRDALEGFCIDAYDVNQDHWTEGFVTVTPKEM